MQVTITFEGPQGCGKTVMADMLAATLKARGVPYMRQTGGGPRGPDSDRLIIQTTPELLCNIADTTAFL